MITQRELDIAQLEAKMKSDKLFEQWSLDFLANRAKRGQDAGQSGAENLEAAEADDSESPGFDPEAGAVLPTADY